MRNSARSPAARIRASASGGSLRHPRASCAPGRQRAQQERDDLPALGAAEEVRVVEHEQEGLGAADGGGDERQDALAHRRDGQREQSGHSRIEVRERLERPAEVREQDHRIVVGRVELHPRGGALVGLDPLHERDRLAGSGRSTDQDERRNGRRQGVDEAAPRDQRQVQARRPQLDVHHDRARGVARRRPPGGPALAPAVLRRLFADRPHCFPPRASCARFTRAHRPRDAPAPSANPYTTPARRPYRPAARAGRGVCDGSERQIGLRRPRPD